MNDTDKTEEPELTEAQRAELAEKEKAVKEHKRTLRDLQFLSTFFLIVMALNVFSIAEASLTVGCALGVFASIGAGQYYRRRGPKK